jgi:hypothetical protein
MEDLKVKINNLELMFINEKDTFKRAAIYQVIFSLQKRFFFIYHSILKDFIGSKNGKRINSNK